MQQAMVTRRSANALKKSTRRAEMFRTSVSEKTPSPKTRSNLAKAFGLKSPHVLLDEMEINRILKDNQQTPKKPVTTTPKRRRPKTQIENLHTDLSPKLTELSPTDGKRSRYGRQQRYKELGDFLPTNIVCYVRRTPSKLKTVTSPGAIFEQKFVSYKSPIEELIKKNKLLASSLETSQTENSEETVPDSNSEAAMGFGGSPISSSVTPSKTNSPKASPKAGSEQGGKDIDSNGNDLNTSNQMVEYVSGLKDGNNEAILRNLNSSPSANSTDSAKGSSIDSDPEVPHVAGIFWGRVASFPYWPCIVWPDPSGHYVSGGLRQQVRLHVRFFADNGRRSWVRRENMLPYNGLEDFNNRMKEAQQKYTKKDRNYKAFVISSTKIALWTIAVSEADDVHAEPVENRFEKFNQILDAARQRVAETKRKNSIRKSSARRNSYLTKDMNSMMPYPGEFTNVAKRMRSETPDSATYESTEGLESFKRLKLEVDDIGTTENSNSLKELTPFRFPQNEDHAENEEFSQFFDIMKTYAMCFNNEDLERKLYQSVQQIWTIRSLGKRELKDTSFSSVLSAGEMTIRRLSSRMRILSKKEKIYSPSTSKISEKKVEKKELSLKKPLSKPLELVVENIIKLSKNYLFKGLNREPVCKICYKPSDLLKCSGLCNLWIHSSCLEESKSTSTKTDAIMHVTGETVQLSKDQSAAGSFLCDQCKMGEEQPCSVCKKTSSDSEELIRCQISWCGKTFHVACLKYWPQAKLTKSSTKIESLLCPCHVCHTCVSDDPRGKFLQIERQKLTKCVLCPATYHLESSCIPAGTRFLTATNIICPRHRQEGKKSQNVNANWCFICAHGGTLICCETCPTAFHIECLKLPQPEEGYICEECETGRMPLYGEIVWAKLGVFRWWPAIIIPPPEVPINLVQMKHNESDFCVRFFGSNNHTWISRRRVFLYQEGDWGRVQQSRNLDQVYKSALAEARQTADLMKEKKSLNKKKEKFLAPLPYIKIKANKAVPPVKLQEVDISELTACDCNPSDENPCGSGCLNRLLQSECNPKICPAGDKCQNQMFEKRLYPPLKLTFTGSKGWGLFCEDAIPAGAFIIEYVGEVIDDAEFKRRIAQKQEEKDENYYFLTLENNYMIDAGPKGNLARFMNHSCEPNCTTQKWNVNGVTRVGLFAIHDINPNTELTFNYNLECIGDKKLCHCGAQKCAGFIGAKYKEPEKLTQKKAKLKTRKNRKMSKDALVTPKN